MASLRDVLSRGYLPKELPYGFSSGSYAQAVASSAPSFFESGGGARKSVAHNLARPGMLTRTLSIPDPVHFYRLAKLIVGDWTRLSAAFSSPFSLSEPTDDPRGARVWVPAEPHSRADARARHGARSRYRVSADVSQFYPSIYTHSLDWAVRGKVTAKAKRATSGLGPLLDIHTRNAQDRQSIGIPIGPDTSLVLAELVLAQVDAEVKGAMGPRVHGFRFYDDYELFTGTRTLADEAIARLTSAMASWQLILNPYKLSVHALPIPVEDAWVTIIKRIKLGASASSERSDLNVLFDEAARLALEHPRDGVMAYALGQIITRDNELRQRLHKENWSHLLNLMLQASLGEPGLLPRVAILASWARDTGWPVPRTQIETSLNLLVQDAASRGNASEVAWGVWVASRLGVRVRPKTARTISSMLDDVVAIVALDARARGTIRSLDVTNWASLMTRESLIGDHWLLAYEAYVHGWLPSADGTDYIATDPAFAHLRSKDVRFYDEAEDLPMPVLRFSKIHGAGASRYLSTGADDVDEESQEMSFYDG